MACDVLPVPMFSLGVACLSASPSVIQFVCTASQFASTSLHTLWHQAVLLFYTKTFQLHCINLDLSCLSDKVLRKGTGYSESTGKVMKDLCGRGTSKSSNELKSWPQPPCQLRLIKIYFLRHNISHLWLKMAIIWPFFSHFWPIFADFLLYRLHLCVL